MKRFIAIFLLLQIASNNAFAEEIIKIPKLFTHFYHHAQEHKDSNNFLDYLYNHYSGRPDSDAHGKKHSEEDQDCNLPFKHCGGCCLNAHVPAVGFTASYLETNYNLYQTAASIFVLEDEHIESLHLCSIWQPPKLA